MSYCIAWKHDNNVFMLSDTAVSSRVDEPSAPYNSMGEKQTTRFGYYVEVPPVLCYATCVLF